MIVKVLNYQRRQFILLKVRWKTVTENREITLSACNMVHQFNGPQKWWLLMSGHLTHFLLKNYLCTEYTVLNLFHLEVRYFHLELKSSSLEKAFSVVFRPSWTPAIFYSPWEIKIVGFHVMQLKHDMDSAQAPTAFYLTIIIRLWAWDFYRVIVDEGAARVNYRPIEIESE